MIGLRAGKRRPLSCDEGKGPAPGDPPELVLAGGRVFDPASGLDGAYDIAIRDRRIAEVAKGLGERFPDRALALGGALVLPGLIDIHTHCYWHGTYFGIRPDPVAGRSGVTSWVDAGSAGAWNFAAFRDLAETSALRVRAFINISAIGLIARTGELDNLDYCNEEDLLSVIAENRAFIVGIKVRMGHPKHGIGPLERAIAVAERVGLPVMVHVRNGPPTIRQLLPLLRAGDILTHCYTGADMALADGKTWVPEAYEARRRGVLFDVGHGGASFGWKSAEIGFAADFQPDLISSDLHLCNCCEPNVDLPQSMSKMLHLGMTLSDVVKATTSIPAAAIGLEGIAGTLRVGALADIAVFELEDGAFAMGDTMGETRTVTRRFRHVLTLAAGQPMPDTVFDRPAPYLKLPDPTVAGAQRQVNGTRVFCGCC